MKCETENAIRSIASMDSEITKDALERAVDILRGKAPTDDDLVSVIRFKDARELLKVHRRTLEYYIEQGYLERVFGGGRRAIGISRASFLRFTARRPAEKRLK